MISVVAIGVGIAFAALLAGCNSEEGEEGKGEPKKPKVPPPPPPSSSSSFITASGYQTEFSRDSLAGKVYQQLKLNGVKDSEFDQGCGKRSYDKDGKMKHTGGGENNKKLAYCEAMGLSLNRWKEFPEIASMITGKPIPWSLDDFDPKTTPDEKIRARFQQTIQFLDQLLQKKGFKPESKEYDGRMVWGLTYRVVVTEHLLSFLDPSKNQSINKWLRGKFRDEIKRIRQELISLDMKEYWHYLKKDSLKEWKSDHSKEYPALLALEKGIGDCTEQSKVLYAVLEMAGYSPRFVEIDRWASDHWVINLANIIDPYYGHVAVGVQFKNWHMLLDPALFAVNPPHHGYSPLNVRQYFALDVSNQAGGPALGEKKGKVSMEKIDFAVRLDGTLPIPLMNRSKTWLKQEKNPEKAMEDARKLLKINPNDAFGHALMGNIYYAQRKWDQSLQSVNKAIELNSEVSLFYVDRADIWFNKGNVAMAEKDLKKALELNPQRWNEHIIENLSKFYKKIRHQVYGQNISGALAIKRELGMDPTEMTAKVILISWLVELEAYEFAEPHLNDLVGDIKNAKGQLKQQGTPLSPHTLVFLQDLYTLLEATIGEKYPIKKLWGPILKP